MGDDVELAAYFFNMWKGCLFLRFFFNKDKAARICIALDPNNREKILEKFATVRWW